MRYGVVLVLRPRLFGTVGCGSDGGPREYCRSETRGLFIRVGTRLGGFKVWGVVLEIESLDCGEILGSEGGMLGMLGMLGTEVSVCLMRFCRFAPARPDGLRQRFGMGFWLLGRRGRAVG